MDFHKAQRRAAPEAFCSFYLRSLSLCRESPQVITCSAATAASFRFPPNAVHLVSQLTNTEFADCLSQSFNLFSPTNSTERSKHIWRPRWKLNRPFLIDTNDFSIHCATVTRRVVTAPSCLDPKRGTIKTISRLGARQGFVSLVRDQLELRSFQSSRVKIWIVLKVGISTSDRNPAAAD